MARGSSLKGGKGGHWVFAPAPIDTPIDAPTLPPKYLTEYF